MLAAGILARTGDLNRFENLAGIRSFTGLVPRIDQSGTSDHHDGPTKAGDPGLRQALFLAADLARKVDAGLAARCHRLYVDAGTHHTSAIGTIAAVLITRIAACWRNGQLYELRDTDGRSITEALDPRWERSGPSDARGQVLGGRRGGEVSARPARRGPGRAGTG